MNLKKLKIKFMFQFFETICVKNKPKNLDFHQRRINYTFKKFYKNYKAFDLNIIFNNMHFDGGKKIKVKIIYSNIIQKIQFEEYIPKYHKKFKLIKIYNNIYKYKFKNRNTLTKYLRKPEEEIIFVLKNHITDTTYSNLIFKKKNQWFTSKKFLLNGTQRQYLIKNKKIKEIYIGLNNLKSFNSFKLINAMLDLKNSQEYIIKDIF